MRHRRHKIRIGRQQSNNLLVILLCLIVLFETILLLFWIPKKAPSKAIHYASKKEAKIESRKVTVKLQERKGRPQEPVTAKIETIAAIPKKEVPLKTKGKIAIVLDDWGYNANHLDILEEIKFPLTLAILPFRDFSRKVSEFGHQHNLEIIIHMPMEPQEKDKAGLEPMTLMISMNEKTIRKILNDAFDNIVYAKGINNHMGSLATQNDKFLTIVFKELKKKDFYFLDSLSTPKSAGYKIARKIGIKSALRSVFLDNSQDTAYIKNQLVKLAKEAEKSGKAIGIGHDRKNTLQALKEFMPELYKEGYVFVFASELVE